MPTAKKPSLSPVEERHIDYILEEEFSVNPDFLPFFIRRAQLTKLSASTIADCVLGHGCNAARSVTTSSGESDVLVTYRSNMALPIAILIEDKIRAGFQPNQASRYRDRGESGKGTQWSDYWTCLVAHEKYVADTADFDAIVSLQDIHAYFAERSDPRSQFRARIIEQTIDKYESNSLRFKDEVVTRFRHQYAEAFEATLPRECWWHQPARDAWWNDTWFECKALHWPKGVLVRHQARSGRVQLIFPLQDRALLNSAILEHASWASHSAAPETEVVPVGKGKLAFQVHVSPVQDFASADAPFEEYFAAIEYLALLYERCSNLLPQHLRLQPMTEVELLGDGHLRRLKTMLLAYMRSTVSLHGTGMPFPFPDLNRLDQSTPSEERHFPSFGLMGGFDLELRHDDDGRPFIEASCGSRQWGSYSVEHRITADEVRRLPDAL